MVKLLIRQKKSLRKKFGFIHLIFQEAARGEKSLIACNKACKVFPMKLRGNYFAVVCLFYLGMLHASPEKSFEEEVAAYADQVKQNAQEVAKLFRIDRDTYSSTRADQALIEGMYQGIWDDPLVFPPKNWSDKRYYFAIAVQLGIYKPIQCLQRAVLHADADFVQFLLQKGITTEDLTSKLDSTPYVFDAIRGSSVSAKGSVQVIKLLFEKYAAAGMTGRDLLYAWPTPQDETSIFQLLAMYCHHYDLEQMQQIYRLIIANGGKIIEGGYRERAIAIMQKSECAACCFLSCALREQVN